MKAVLASLILPGLVLLLGLAGCSRKPLKVTSDSSMPAPQLTPSNNSTPEVSDATQSGFRISLSKTLAVASTDILGADRVFLVPYNGNQVSLFNGTIWNPLTISKDLIFEVAIPATPSAIFDIFAYLDGGDIKLFANPWGITRTDAITILNGVLVRSSDPRYRYLGTVATNSAGQLEDSRLRRFVWNAVNRTTRSLNNAYSVSPGPSRSWFVTSSATLSPANVTSPGTNRVEWVVGLDGSKIQLAAKSGFFLNSNISATCDVAISIGVNGQIPATQAPTIGRVVSFTSPPVELVNSISLTPPQAGYYYASHLEARATTCPSEVSSSSDNHGLFGTIEN